MKYKNYIIKPRVCYRTFKYSIYKEGGITYVGQARNLKEAKEVIRDLVNSEKTISSTNTIK